VYQVGTNKGIKL